MPRSSAWRECLWIGTRAARLAGVAAALSLALAATAQDGASGAARKPLPAAAASAATIYVDERDCSDKDALEATECHNAALNSRAEYEEKAPRFDANEACTRVFGAHNCSMRIGVGAKGIGFLPSYRGFTLVRGKGGAEMMVLPALAGASRLVEFTPRPVSRLDADQDAARAARAQAAWQRAHASVIRSAGGGPRYRDAPKGVMPDLSDDAGAAQSGPAATYPVSPSMLKAMQDEMRKYGHPSPK
ncbi:Protein of unknown function [Rhizobiales bacterium GAS191]|nr:Protein of unknown function [Rhizobiales bacterium GAS191]